jgi:hypothetical protein
MLSTLFIYNPRLRQKRTSPASFSKHADSVRTLKDAQCFQTNKQKQFRNTFTIYKGFYNAFLYLSLLNIHVWSSSCQIFSFFLNWENFLVSFPLAVIKCSVESNIREDLLGFTVQGTVHHGGAGVSSRSLWELVTLHPSSSVLLVIFVSFLKNERA